MSENRVFISETGQTEYSFEDGIKCSRIKLIGAFGPNGTEYRGVLCKNLDTNEECTMFIPDSLVRNNGGAISGKSFYAQHSVKNNFIITLIEISR